LEYEKLQTEHDSIQESYLTFLVKHEELVFLREKSEQGKRRLRNGYLSDIFTILFLEKEILRKENILLLHKLHELVDKVSATTLLVSQKDSSRIKEYLTRRYNSFVFFLEMTELESELTHIREHLELTQQPHSMPQFHLKEYIEGLRLENDESRNQKTNLQKGKLYVFLS
jgi:hypothetical protein